MRHSVSVVSTIPILIGLLSACTHDSAQRGPEGDASSHKEAAALLERVKQRYIEINPSPQRITQQARTMTRALGRPDIETRSTLVTLQEQDRQRTEMTDCEVIVHPTQPGGQVSRYPGGKLVSVRENNVISVTYEGTATGPDVKPAVISFKIDESKMDPELVALYGGDLATLKLFDIMSKGPLRLSEAALRGQEEHVVETVAPFNMARGTQATIKLWIGPKSLMVDRMEMEFTQQLVPTGPDKAYVDYAGDFTYEVNVPTARAGAEAFTPVLHPSAEDYTDETQEFLKADPAKDSIR